VWRHFAREHGFPADRLEAAACNGHAAAAQAMGARVRPRDLVPQFGDGRAAKRARLMVMLDSHGRPPDD